MTRRIVIALALIVALLFSSVSTSAQQATTKPPRKISPPGQIQIATVNARQNEILGLKRIISLIELAKALRFRPPAFNGGVRGAVAAPDIAVISEFRPPNVEVFARLLRLRFDVPYEIIGPSDAQAAFIVNTDQLSLRGDVELIDDACLNDVTSDKRRMQRRYPLAQFTEKATGAVVNIVGVHLARDYSASGQKDCQARNVRAIRDRLNRGASPEGAVGAPALGPTFIAGDFNFRPTKEPYECDPNEQTQPARWWAALTSPEDGSRPFLDAVRVHHRSEGERMADEWTYEHPRMAPTCDGREAVRRSRLDYIFAADSVVAEAHADHPGWSVPGVPKYSDHRYVLGRFVVSGPPRPDGVVSVPDAGGVVHLSWDPVEGESGWVLYRARAGRPYGKLARLSPETLSFDDHTTTHGVAYRYSIAAIGPERGHSLEARPSWATADARGPHVSSITPPRGAERVSIFTRIRATFDEFAVASSVGPNTISLYRNGRAIAGRVVRKGGFVVKFVPKRPLVKGDGYTIVVRSVSDALGNIGPVFRSRFTTVPKPRKQRR
ncbi:MAG: Ig-like domain-containing protein [Actinomycetota bacterium]|nr:Ig-like domain-containing protein [Actinomycetota bacterium]